MMNNKKNLITTLSMAAVLAGSTCAYADNSNSSQTNADNNNKVIIAIQELGNKIESLAKSSVKSINTIAYQLDKSLSATVLLNTQQADLQKRTRVHVQKETDQAVKFALQPFSSATLTYTNASQPEVKKVESQSKARENFINQLKNLEASDSIYSLVQGIEVSSFWTRKNLGAPQRNDDAFNFGALIEPDAYTPEQAKNSDNFIGFATKQYQSYTDGINLSKLRSALVNFQNQGTKVLSQKIDEFRKNEAYRNYQMTIRSMTASKSVATDILSSIAAERKPIMTSEPDSELAAISRAVGVEPKMIEVTTADGQKIQMYRYASAMQIAKYRANYRLNSPQWYQEVASDSIENLQRKSVIILAEISSQLYQNHMDNEKMLGALAMMSLQSNDLASLTLKTQVQDVNNAINSFAGGASKTSSPSTSTYNSTNTTGTSDSTTPSTNPNDYDLNNYNSTNPSTNPDDYKIPTDNGTSK